MAQSLPKIDPASSALLVMDVEHATLKSVAGADALLSRIGKAIAVARAHNLLVGYVRMALEDDELDALPDTNKLAGHMAASGRALHEESGSSAIPGAVAPEEDDIVVRKTRVGAFSTTDLNQQLQQRGITTLVLVGISTSAVVLSTVRDAADRDYQVFVLRDASADPAPDVHDFLNERIFPSQAEVITVADFDAALPATKPGQAGLVGSS